MKPSAGRKRDPLERTDTGVEQQMSGGLVVHSKEGGNNEGAFSDIGSFTLRENEERANNTQASTRRDGLGLVSEFYCQSRGQLLLTPAPTKQFRLCSNIRAPFLIKACLDQIQWRSMQLMKSEVVALTESNQVV